MHAHSEKWVPNEVHKPCRCNRGYEGGAPVSFMRSAEVLLRAGDGRFRDRAVRPITALGRLTPCRLFDAPRPARSVGDGPPMANTVWRGSGTRVEHRLRSRLGRAAASVQQQGAVAWCMLFDAGAGQHQRVRGQGEGRSNIPRVSASGVLVTEILVGGNHLKSAPSSAQCCGRARGRGRPMVRHHRRCRRWSGNRRRVLGTRACIVAALDQAVSMRAAPISGAGERIRLCAPPPVRQGAPRRVLRPTARAAPYKMRDATMTSRSPCKVDPSANPWPTAASLSASSC